MEDGLRILIVDDDVVDRMAVVRLLRKTTPNCRIEEAEDGAVGFQTVRDENFDCVFLDYRLPGADGLMVLKKIRAEGIRTPVIMLTRLGDEEIAVEMMKSGASDYLSKDKMSADVLSRSVQYVIKSCQAEQKLQESQERYEVAVRGANDGIWDWNLQTNEIHLSGRWKSMVGCDENEIDDRPESWFDRIHPEDLERVKAQVAAHLEGREPFYESEHRILHKDGTYRWVLSRGLAVRDQTGKATRMAGSQTDITERKNSEVEREELFQQALEADRRKDEFLAIVSHELRTPLTAILGWVQLIRSGKITDSHTQRGLEVIEKSARLQRRIVEDLLDVAQILKGRLQLNFRPVRMEQVVQSALESLSSVAETKHVEIVSEISANLEFVRGDADRIQQMVWNLLYNAVKFTPSRGQVKIHVAMEEKSVVVRVTDTGIGINPEFLPYVFDRFRQEQHPNTRTHGGLGLGLAIVRHLVELHQGSIAASSEGRGHGATFTLRLPTMDAEKADASQSVIAGDSVLNGLQILIVEDDADNREVLSSALEQYGARVFSAGSAAEALTLLRTEWPNVLVSDIAMPDEDGYSLIRKVRLLELERGKRIPSIALTAYASTEDRTMVLSAGYQAHVAKPVEVSRLAAMIVDLTNKQ